MAIVDNAALKIISVHVLEQFETAGLIKEGVILRRPRTLSFFSDTEILGSTRIKEHFTKNFNIKIWIEPKSSI